MGLRFCAAALLLAAAFGSRVVAGGAADVQGPKTVRDRVYTRAQAEAGGTMYAKLCDHCHDPLKVPEGKKPGPPTIGEKFLETWRDRTLGELYGTILNTMPNDGSAFLSEDETLNLIAYMLKANGFPEGETALKFDEAMKAIAIVPIK
jgi:cytochrome c5